MPAYLAVVAVDGRDAGTIMATRQATLDAAGLSLRHASPSLALFATADTAVLASGDGSLVIGRRFACAGPMLPQPPPARDLQQALDEAWGEYLLIQATDAGIRIMRDPSGAVACVHVQSHDHVLLTSDISLVAELGLHRPSIDWEYIEHCLAFPYLKIARTALSGVRELLPGCSLHILPGLLKEHCDWSPWRFVARDQRHRDPVEAAADVRQAVHRAVTTLADCGHSRLLLELSGGLDSSIVATNLRKAGNRVSAHTLLTPVPGADERHYAQCMSDQLGIALQVEPLGFDDAQYRFPLPRASVAPRIGMLQYAVDQVMTRAGRRQQITHYFSGGGGDTVFGYLMNAAPAADAFRECGFRTGMAAIQDLSTLHQCTASKAARLTLAKLLRRPCIEPPADSSFLPANHPTDTLEPHPWWQPPEAALPGDCKRIGDLAGTQAFMDGLDRGGGTIHMPLLAQPVMEACLRVPSWMWIAGGRNRAIARDAFADTLPAAVLHRLSKGTFISYSGAVYRRHHDGIREFLLDGMLQSRGLLDADAIRRFMARELAPRDQSFMRLFTLCMIENWVRQQA